MKKNKENNKKNLKHQFNDITLLLSIAHKTLCDAFDKIQELTYDNEEEK